MVKRHVVIGGGPAGIFAVETIRELDHGDSEITLISDGPPYSRMVLPYYVAGEIPEDHVFTGKGHYFDRLKVHTIFGRRVTGVDPKGNVVTLSGGSPVPFDDVLIATGSSPARLTIPGAEGRGVRNLWSLEDARETLAAIGGRQARVVFVGAGFIGLIILNALAKIGCQLTVVEVESQVLPKMLDPRGGELVRAWLEEKGIAVQTGVSAIAIGDRGDQKRISLSDGQGLVADLVVMAVGVRPNLEPVAGSGIATRQGILINDRCQTNFPHVYAAGDVAEGPDLSTGDRAVHAIQPTAVEHGRVAGANMAGSPVSFPGSLSMNILDVVGLQCASFGLWQNHGREATTTLNPGRPLYRKLVWDDDRIVGAILLGPAQDVALLNDLGMIKGLIQSRVRLGEWKRYIQENPTDIRRPYVASKAAALLLERTLLGRPAAERGYRFRDLVPGGDPGVAHRLFTETRPQT